MKKFGIVFYHSCNIYFINACSSGKFNFVKFFINEHEIININIKNEEDETILFYACLSGNENLVKYLVRNG